MSFTSFLGFQLTPFPPNDFLPLRWAAAAPCVKSVTQPGSAVACRGQAVPEERLSKKDISAVFRRERPFVLFPEGHMASQTPTEQKKFLRSSLELCFCSISGHKWSAHCLQDTLWLLRVTWFQRVGLRWNMKAVQASKAFVYETRHAIWFRENEWLAKGVCMMEFLHSLRNLADCVNLCRLIRLQ